MSELMTIPATIVRKSESEDEDDYGNKIPGEPEEIETFCWLEQTRASENGNQGELSDTSWNVYFPEGVVVETKDAVVVEGHGRFEAIGDSWAVDDPEAGGIDHVEANLRRTGKA